MKRIMHYPHSAIKFINIHLLINFIIPIVSHFLITNSPNNEFIYLKFNIRYKYLFIRHVFFLTTFLAKLRNNIGLLLFFNQSFNLFNLRSSLIHSWKRVTWPLSILLGCFYDLQNFNRVRPRLSHYICQVICGEFSYRDSIYLGFIVFLSRKNYLKKKKKNDCISIKRCVCYLNWYRHVLVVFKKFILTERYTAYTRWIFSLTSLSEACLQVNNIFILWIHYVYVRR